MTHFPAPDSTRSRRPYWLLLVLALFMAGQCLSVSHWHATTSGSDFDCALCVLSSANQGSAPASGWLLLDLAFFSFVFLLLTCGVRRSALRFHDSRAPPVS